MIGKAYNPTWARNEVLRTDVRRWHQAGLLTLPQLEAIQQSYPLNFYRPPLYLRLLLFVLTVVAWLLAAGLGFFFFLGPLAQASRIDLPETIIIGVGFELYALGSWLILENFIRANQLYRAGHDVALLYMTLGCASAAMFCLLSPLLPSSNLLALTSPLLPLFLLPVLGILLVAIIRYADALVTAAAYGVVLALLANALLRFEAGRLLLPFAVMLLSVGLYQLGQRLARRTDYLYYQYCFLTLKTLALVTFYLGGNYMVVREGNAAISGDLVSQQIPFAWVFYLSTALIPLYYIYHGLRRPDRVWLLTGLVAVAFSGYTVRFYHSVLPPEVASTLLGAALVALTGALLRYLRTPRHGLTAAADTAHYSGLNLEALVTAETAARQGHTPASHFGFGGGQSGGGGATGQF
ncbi:hypothetical protein MUN82_15590 [Hymenobacter aerilatus]|uniref:Uncharacterized protein n=1 Tax=Hymenobacter aerilatus TaxID=2932251 RepID=A0A8T9SQC8_9BACT|nr:hypothetical protein [Hymenobacter aerilatus]UOR04358.1 hypothetical protein MUN82_15590 [Hymenobacter aerilatus]